MTEVNFPKSKHNLQCIGPCYHSNTVIVHPLTLQYVRETDNAFCPVQEFEYTDPVSGKTTNKLTDMCFNPTAAEDIKNTSSQSSIMIPIIDFNAERFLKLYYKIYSFEDAIDYIEKHNYTALKTRSRIIDCAWETFGKDLDLIDQRIADFYVELMKKKWMPYIYDKLHQYITIDNNKIIFSKPSKEIKEKLIDDSEFKIEGMNFLAAKFATHEEIYKFIIKYLKYRKKTWSEIDNHTDKLKEDLVEYIEQKIKLTLEI
jgi:hypothetical protein